MTDPPSNTEKKRALLATLRIVTAGVFSLCTLVSCGSDEVSEAEKESASTSSDSGDPATPKAPETNSQERATVSRRGGELPAVPGVSQEDFRGQMAKVMETSDHIGKEWNTEIFTLAVNKKLEQLAEWMGDGAIEEKNLQLISHESVQSTRLRHDDLETVFEDSLVRVKRWQRQSSAEASEFELSTSALARHLNELLVPLQSATNRRVKFKTYRVDPASDRVATTAHYHAKAVHKQGTVEQTATLKFEWTVELQPRVVTLTVEDYEEVTPSASENDSDTAGSSGGLRFADRAPQVFSQERSYSDQLTRGVDYWRKHLQADFGIDVNGLQGVALGDANGDGLEDLFVCQHGGLPNKLFARNKDGTLQDISAESGLDWMELTRAALFVDLDNDGDQDLAMTQGWYWVLMENDGNARFTKRAETRGSAWYYSIAAADYDNDGDLDLYICGRNPSAEQRQSEGFLGTPIPFHDANNGGPNLLLNNRGSWKFADVTATVGMDVNNRRYSYAAVWEDYDNDGDQDLYVANDFGRNCLYRNNRGKFTEVAAKAGVEDISAGMGVTWADIDHDGDMDLHVSNMFSSAGNRIAYQRNFRTRPGESRAGYRRHARGNSLFANNGNGTFSDVSTHAGITMGRWAWGARFADFNNDGWEDLFVANGFVTTEDTGDL